MDHGVLQKEKVAMVWRWLVIVLATVVWGLPLSVASNMLGYGCAAGWLLTAIGVLLSDLSLLIWWRSLKRLDRNSEPPQDALSSDEVRRFAP
jgi:hypothetical protein